MFTNNRIKKKADALENMFEKYEVADQDYH